MKKTTIILLAIIIGLLALVYVWVFVYNKAHVDYFQQEEAFKGAAAEFYELAIADPSAWNEKSVDLQGAVLSVEGRTAILKPNVQLRLDEDIDLPEGWSTAETLRLKCRFVGTEEDILTDEILIRCDQCKPL